MSKEGVIIGTWHLDFHSSHRDENLKRVLTQHNLVHEYHLPKYKDEDIQNYKFACFEWVCNMVKPQ